MNNSSEISLSSNSSELMETYFDMWLLVDIFTLINFPINSYVIWLIVRGTGNGLAAEIFILCLSICEIILCLGCVLDIIASYQFIYEDIAWMIVCLFDGLVNTGHALFECLICVERYLAVIHPVTFLKYKPLRYRLMCCAVAWVATFGFGVLSALTSYFDVLYILLIPLTQFFLTFFIQLFCCVAVLRALKQSGPGERGKERDEENHMKRRAFYLILITTVSMAITYLPLIITITLFYSIDENLLTVMSISSACFALGGLVQPILFFYRVGKLNFIRCQ